MGSAKILLVDGEERPIYPRRKTQAYWPLGGQPRVRLRPVEFFDDSGRQYWPDGEDGFRDIDDNIWPLKG